MLLSRAKASVLVGLQGAGANNNERLLHASLRVLTVDSTHKLSSLRVLTVDSTHKLSSLRVLTVESTHKLSSLRVLTVESTHKLSSLRVLTVDSTHKLALTAFFSTNKRKVCNSPSNTSVTF